MTSAMAGQVSAGPSAATPSACSAIQPITSPPSPRLTRAQWTATVTKMQQKYAAPISTNNVEALVSYLTVNYGREAAPAK